MLGNEYRTSPPVVITSHAEGGMTRDVLHVPTQSQSPQRESQARSVHAEQERATTPVCQPDANIYGSDLTAADVLEDEEALDEEVLDEFAHRRDEEDEDVGSPNGAQGSTCEGTTLPPPPDTARSGSSTRATLPTWLAAEYQSIRERLTTEMKKNTSGLPLCYQRHSFYDGVDSPYLAAKSTFQLSASIFHQPQIFVWLPHTLVDKIPCPACYAASRQAARSSRVYLQRHSFAPYPRRVVDVDRNVYIVGYRYACGHKDCRKTFFSWNSAILDMLPRPLRDQFQFRLTYRSGLTLRLASLLRESFSAGIGPEQFTTMIEAAHYQQYDLLQCQFLEMVLHRSEKGALSTLWAKATPFGVFRDRSGYAGFVPSARYFARFYDMLVEESAPAMRQLIASLPADVIKQDHSFKVLSHLCARGSTSLLMSDFDRQSNGLARLKESQPSMPYLQQSMNMVKYAQ